MRKLAPVVCLMLAGGLFGQNSTAYDVFEHGRAAEKDGHITEAYLAYAQAAAMDPGNKDYWKRAQTVRFRAALEVAAQNGIAGRMPDLDHEEPPTKLPAASYEDRQAVRQALPPIELHALPVVKDFDLRGDAKQLFTDVAKAYGLECIFDTDYMSVGTVHFVVTGMNYREALYALQSATASFAVPLSEKLFLVARETPQKRIELEPMAAVSIPLPNLVATTDFNQVVTAVQQALALEKVTFDSQMNTVILRDRVSKIIPARAMLEDLMRQRGELAIDLKLIEVSRNDIVQYGVNFSADFSFQALGNFLQNTVTASSNLSGFLSFGGGKTLVGIGLITPQLVAKLSDSTGKVLYDAEIPAIEGTATSVHLGERYPVASNGYYGSTTSSNSNTYTPPPSFTYEDLGLSMKVTSRLHGTEAATMDIESEFKLLTGELNDGIPIIRNRKLKSTVRLELGQWAILTGLMDISDARTVSGVPGLTRIPGLSFLTTQRQRTKTNDELVILLRPRLLALPADQFPTRSYGLGTDARPRIPL